MFVWDFVLWKFLQNEMFRTFLRDTVAEWLRRWTRNPLGSARVGSNPTGVVFYFVFRFNWIEACFSEVKAWFEVLLDINCALIHISLW